MNTALLAGSAAVAAVAGALAGAYQRTVIARIPARAPRRPAIEGITAVAWASITAVAFAAHAPTPASVAALLAFLWFAASSIALTVIDLDTRRLPDAVTVPALVVSLALFGLSALLSSSPEALVRAIAGGAILFGFYLLLRLAQPRGMGMGDVKLAALVGLHLGWIGWWALAVGALAAFVLGGLFGAALIVARRARLATAIPFGPWMLAGAWIGVVGGEAVGRVYGGGHA